MPWFGGEQLRALREPTISCHGPWYGWRLRGHSNGVAHGKIVNLTAANNLQMSTSNGTIMNKDWNSA